MAPYPTQRTYSRDVTDWTGAEVTQPVPFDKTHGMSIVEMLTFWMECARQKTMQWRISAVRTRMRLLPDEVTHTADFTGYSPQVLSFPRVRRERPYDFMQCLCICLNAIHMSI